MDMSFADEIAAWAAKENSVQGLTLIGSQARSENDQVWRADKQSDWDFQIISSRPNLFLNRAWTRRLTKAVQVYAIRRASIGGVPKIAVLFEEIEADLVIIPAKLLKLLRFAVSLGLHRRSTLIQRRVQELAVVIRPGWKFLKGADGWDAFYRRVIVDVADPRLSDDDIRDLADGFVCDYVWTNRKLARGELIAAQRMLHRSLAETNMRFFHELKMRRRERTFPEGRRAEMIASEDQLNLIRVSALCDELNLRTALDRSASCCRELVNSLLEDTWSWPHFQK